MPHTPCVSILKAWGFASCDSWDDPLRSLFAWGQRCEPKLANHPEGRKASKLLVDGNSPPERMWMGNSWKKDGVVCGFEFIIHQRTRMEMPSEKDGEYEVITTGLMRIPDSYTPGTGNPALHRTKNPARWDALWLDAVFEFYPVKLAETSMISAWKMDSQGFFFIFPEWPSPAPFRTCLWDHVRGWPGLGKATWRIAGSSEAYVPHLISTKILHTCSEMHAMWGPRVISWFIKPINYSYKML